MTANLDHEPNKPTIFTSNNRRATTHTGKWQVRSDLNLLTILQNRDYVWIMSSNKWKIENADKMRKYRRDHYHKNKTYYLSRQIRLNSGYRKARLDFLTSMKKPCAICCESDTACIDFHHIDPSLKRFTISSSVNGLYSKQEVLKEIQKCICLCANCHRKLHAGKLALPAGIEPA